MRRGRPRRLYGPQRARRRSAQRARRPDSSQPTPSAPPAAISTSAPSTPLAVSRVEKAIADARASGLLGENILGSGFSFDAKVRLGAAHSSAARDRSHRLDRGQARQPQPPPPILRRRPLRPTHAITRRDAGGGAGDPRSWRVLVRPVRRGKIPSTKFRSHWQVRFPARRGAARVTLRDIVSTSAARLRGKASRLCRLAARPRHDSRASASRRRSATKACRNSGSIMAPAA